MQISVRIGCVHVDCHQEQRGHADLFEPRTKLWNQAKEARWSVHIPWKSLKGLFCLSQFNHSNRRNKSVRSYFVRRVWLRSASTNAVCSTWKRSRCFSGKTRDPASVSSRSTYRCRTVCVRWLSQTVQKCWILWKYYGTLWRKSVFTFKSIAYQRNLPQRNMEARKVCHSAYKWKPIWRIPAQALEFPVLLQPLRKRERDHLSWFMRPPVKLRSFSKKLYIFNVFHGILFTS